MRAATQHQLADDVIQEIGAIAAIEDGRFVIEGNGRFRAKRAVSCLVEPEVGDEVLFAGRSSGDLYVLAVLERKAAGAVLVRAPGDLTIKADGRIAIASPEGVDVVTSKNIALTGGGIEVRAGHGHVFVRHLDFIGEKLVGEVEALKVVSGKIERIAERVIERVKRSYRFIEEMDQLRAGQIEYVAEETMRLKGENAFVQADKLAKVDGDQIHLG